MLLRTPGELFLIVRSSSLGQGGRRPPGRALGERYALEASVRRSGDRIRITAQLIDATTAHRGAEHYDRKIEDVFAVQDELVRTIVAFLAAHQESRNQTDARQALQQLESLRLLLTGIRLLHRIQLLTAVSNCNKV